MAPPLVKDQEAKPSTLRTRKYRDSELKVQLAREAEERKQAGERAWEVERARQQQHTSAMSYLNLGLSYFLPSQTAEEISAEEEAKIRREALASVASAAERGKKMDEIHLTAEKRALVSEKRALVSEQRALEEAQSARTRAEERVEHKKAIFKALDIVDESLKKKRNRDEQEQEDSRKKPALVEPTPPRKTKSAANSVGTPRKTKSAASSVGTPRKTPGKTVVPETPRTRKRYSARSFLTVGNADFVKGLTEEELHGWLYVCHDKELFHKLDEDTLRAFCIRLDEGGYVEMNYEGLDVNELAELLTVCCAENEVDE